MPTQSVADLSVKLKTQRGIKIDHEVIPGANHFFENKTEELTACVGGYLDMRMAKAIAERKTSKDRSKEAERDRLREQEQAEAPAIESGPAEDDGGGDD